MLDFQLKENNHSLYFKYFLGGSLVILTLCGCFHVSACAAQMYEVNCTTVRGFLSRTIGSKDILIKKSNENNRTGTLKINTSCCETVNLHQL